MNSPLASARLDRAFCADRRTKPAASHATGRHLMKLRGWRRFTVELAEQPLPSRRAGKSPPPPTGATSPAATSHAACRCCRRPTPSCRPKVAATIVIIARSCATTRSRPACSSGSSRWSQRMDGRAGRRARAAAKRPPIASDAPSTNCPGTISPQKCSGGVFYGHTEAEILWTRDAAQVTIEAIRCATSAASASRPMARCAC